MNGKQFAKKWMGKKVRWPREKKFGWPNAPEHAYGWVIGFTYRRPGETEYDLDSGYYYKQTEPSVFVVQVRCWPWAKPEDVALDDLELWDGDVPTYNQQHMGEKDFEKYRQQEREAVEDAPRDEKGRFVRR